MISALYNLYHNKNKRIQYRIVSKNNYTYQQIISLIEKFFSPNKKLLDIGCGVGTVSFYAASIGLIVKGIDISSRAINLAYKSKRALELTRVSFKIADVVDPSEYSENTYDYAICSEVIEHVVNDTQLLNNIFKALKANGLLIVSTPLISAPLYKWGYLDEFETEVGHLRRYSRSKLTKMLKTNGFEIEEVILTEGLLRNILYTNKNFGWLVRFIRWPLTYIVNFVDSILISLFGASNIYIVARKCRKK